MPEVNWEAHIVVGIHPQPPVHHPRPPETLTAVAMERVLGSREMEVPYLT